MFELNHVLSFVLAVLALFLVPGPAVLLTITKSISGGRRAGIATSLGIALGDGVHTLMAALGLSALLTASAAAFRLVKIAGVAYLLYLGVRAWIQPSASIPHADENPTGLRSDFRQAFLTEVLNPRTALFFLAFLPQFVRPAYGPVITQLIGLGSIFVALSIGYTSLLAFVSGVLGSRFVQHAGVARWQGKLTGSVYIGLAVHLLLQQP